ncbi:ferric-chelate reductase [Rhexocercosporidium sp. MPI-PUGE-AT-0058]|nr:ferric-chelate reductase [Rhexocercosporidium sp. MPI-PUGE-AT-0058]
MLPLYILLLGYTSIAWASLNDPSDFCFGGCEVALRIFTFNSSSKQNQNQSLSQAQQECANAFKIPSLYLCLRTFCTEDERIRGLKQKNETCERESGVSLPRFEIVDEYGDEDVRRLRSLGREEMKEEMKAGRGTHMVLSEVVVLEREVWRLGFRTLDAAYFETRIHNLYGCAMYFFWVVVVVIGLSSHIGQYLLSSRHHNTKWQSLPHDDNDAMDEPTTKWKRSLFDKPYTLLKRYVTVPATFGYKRSQNVRWCTIPTRVQSLTIGAFVVINIVLCSCSYRIFADNMYWPRMSDQALRYFADRTGIISTANLPLIWAFGIRNNTLLWLTGWDFATYNNFHRWVARVSTIEAVLHSVAYTVMILAGEASIKEAWAYYLTYYEAKYFVNGVFATIFMVAILVVSVYPLRRNFYEIFLLLHIVLSIFVIITMYYHVEIFPGYTTYIWPCIFIWIFDRALRLLRILFFNAQFWSTKALTTYDPKTNIIRTTVPHASSFIKPRPGTFYYIYTFNSWKFWENHPFTLAYSTPETSPSEHSSLNSTSLSLGTITPPRRTTSPSNTNSQLDSITQSPESAALLSSSTFSEPSSPSLSFLIRPYKGFTSRLRNSASTLQSFTTHPILIEGPYGETQPLHKYETILFVVGGTGIAVPLSYLSTLLGGEARTREVRIVWAVRERGFLVDVLRSDFRAACGGEDGDVEGGKMLVRAFVTRRENGRKDDEVEEDIGKRRGVEVLRGRPNVYEEVENVVQEAGDGSLAVVACGPGMMADDTRKAVVEMLGRGYGRVEYFEESFNW